MAVVIVIALGATALARGRWSGPWWLVLIGAVVACPFSHTLLDRVSDAPGGRLRWAFQTACGMLLAVLVAPFTTGSASRTASAPFPVEAQPRWPRTARTRLSARIA
ncbi:hypothetical protein ACIRFH_35915 [Streptomyces sp. NPDC093586]|uniref:hypothetical protein n=1 Tax=Streptomyces sp. NPDC093586 TaxID=3366042 RepID=UPI00382B0698